MNLLNHETKMKLFSDNLSKGNIIGGPKWSQNIQELVRKSSTNPKQLSSKHHDSSSQSNSNNRLVKKLVNIHQATESSSKNTSQLGPTTRDLQKRMALEDCTNFLQSKTIQ
jgi:hypothetical protein